MPLSPVGQRRLSLADAAYESIIDAVMSGEIGPGDRLIMDQLADQLEVSRTPVRDALHRLEQEGLIEPAGRRGFVVRVLDDNEIAQIYAAREAIEGYAARLLVEFEETSSWLTLLARSLDEAAVLQDGTPAGGFAANRLVHRRVVELTGNRFLLSSFDSLWGLGLAVFAFIQRFPVDPDVDDVRSDHETLLTALTTRDPDQAQRAMVAHIREGFDRFTTTVEPIPDSAQAKQ